ncbi:glycosyltransferase family 2 protein [Flavobacterium akiainvivens]|nr:glycosyltransferase family 2 protein [Flavobacterium akiainvivens]
MKVSVLINNYNYGRYLKECLDSLEAQSVKADEVILYDDGSSDDSIEIASKYSFVKIISNTNFGEKPAFNQANAINISFKESTGDIICLLDSDDFFDKDKIKTVKEEFERNNNLVFLQHAYNEYIDGKITRIVDYSVKNIDYKTLYRKKNYTAFFNPTSTMSFSRGYLSKMLPIVKDNFWRVWPDVRVSRLSPYYGETKSLPNPLTYYRRHGNNDSGIMNKNHKNTLLNQIDHHEYINTMLDKMKREKINYRKSFSFFKFWIKASFFNKM